MCELADQAGALTFLNFERRFDAGRQQVRDWLAIYRLGVLALCSGRDVIDCGPDLHELMQPEHFSHSVHPTAAGHRVMAELVAPALRTLLPE